MMYSIILLFSNLNKIPSSAILVNILFIDGKLPMSFADLLTKPIFIFLSILKNSCIKSTPFKKINFYVYEFFEILNLQNI
jgi:hypothetical protein